MPVSSRAGGRFPPRQSLLQSFPGVLLAPLPLALLQPVLTRIAQHVAQSRPELFARLGPHRRKRYLIDPIDLPFVLMLVPDAAQPYLRAHRRYENPSHDARVSGTFFNLLDMIDGARDGDALFFSRDLRVSGDTEAVVALRNALDDFEGSALDSIAESFGPLAWPAALTVTGLRAIRGRSGHA